MSQPSPPSEKELEVTLLGPGYGESILIHLGNNAWIIIDSCIDVSSNIPAPLTYLESIGVNPSKAVKYIFATHWHDDHIRGISKIIETCKNAGFCCSMALSRKEFINNVTKYEVGNTIVGGSGAREIVKVLLKLQNTSPKRAVSGMLLKRFDDLTLEPEIWALSPSDKQIDQFLADVASMCPAVNETRIRLLAEHINNSSLVLWIKVGDIKILLGGDLEETSDKDTGWSVILKSEGWKNERAKIFKIPHHGSENAHSQDVWTYMLSESPIAILTPFNKGKKKLPADSDAERILGHTNDAFITVKKTAKNNKNRGRVVEKMIKETVIEIRQTVLRPGQITLRKDLENATEWNVILRNGACHLSDF